MESNSHTEVHADIKGHITGQVAVGAPGSYILQIEEMHGGVIQCASDAEQPHPRLRSEPASILPRPLTGMLDREIEIFAAESAFNNAQPIEFCGSSGMGKTAILRWLAHNSSGMTPDGIVYLSAFHLTVNDLLQCIYEAFYETDIPYKPSQTEIRRSLQGKQSLILLDDIELAREELDTLLDITASCHVVFASSERRLWGDGCDVNLKGLPIEAGLALIEREIGRLLTSEEQQKAKDMCTGLRGSPLAIIQAAALIRDAKSTFESLIERSESPEGDKAPAAVIPEKLDAEQKEVVAVMTTLAASPVRVEHVAEISGVPHVVDSLQALAQDGLIHYQEGEVRIRKPVAYSVEESLDLAPWKERSVKYFADWAEQHQNEPHQVKDSLAVLVYQAESAVEAGKWEEVARLVKAADGAAALSGKWDAWEKLLQWGMMAAQATGDEKLRAWVLHQSGTRAFGLGDRSTAQECLSQALDLRTAEGDEAGASVTKHNLDIVTGTGSPPPSTPREPSHPGPESHPAYGNAPFLIGAVLLVVTALLIAVMWPKPLRLQGINLDLTEVVAGAELQGVISLSGPAPNDGAVVDLRCDKACVNIPTAVTIPGGLRSMAFKILTLSPSSPTRAYITASYQGGERAANLLVIPRHDDSSVINQASKVEVESLSLARNNLLGGESTTAIVKLNRPAPAGGIRVLLNGTQDFIIVPSAVVISKDNTTRSFSVDTVKVNRPEQAMITASYDQSSKSAALIISTRRIDIGLQDFSIKEDTVDSGETATAYVKLDQPAPDGGTIVNIVSNPSVIQNPEFIVIKAGQDEETAKVTVKKVQTSTGAVVTASCGKTKLKDQLQVTAKTPPVKETAIDKLTFGESTLRSGDSTTGYVRLREAAPADIIVNLECKSEAVILPDTVKISSGESTASFDIKAGKVSENTPVRVTASYKDSSDDEFLTVTPPPQPAIKLMEFNIFNNTAESGGSVRGIVVLSGPAPEGGAEIILESKPDVIRDPHNISIDPGITRILFTKNIEDVRETTTANIKASYGGSSLPDSLRVRVKKPPKVTLDSVTVDPENLNAGEVVSVKVVLTGPAPPQGVVVKIYNKQGVVSVNDIRIPAGQTSRTEKFKTTLSESTSNNVEITGTYEGVTKSDFLDIKGVLM